MRLSTIILILLIVIGGAWLIAPFSFWLGIRVSSVIRPPIGTKLAVNSSAYASSPYQTDNSPCVTAAGTIVRVGTAASNFLPLGTVVTVVDPADSLLTKDLIVEDRMHPRFAGRYLDIWFPSTSQALEFGRRQMEIAVVEYGEPGQKIGEERLAASPPTEEPPAEDAPPGRWELVKLRVRVLTAFLQTRISQDVNRYDVDCSKQRPLPA